MDGAITKETAIVDCNWCENDDSQTDIDSPLFNSNSLEDSVKFSVVIEEDDDSLLPPSAECSTAKVRSVISAMELDGLEESDFPDKGHMPEKQATDVNRIIQQIKTIILFEGYDEDELKLVTEYMYLKTVEAGEVVIKIGDVGDAIYVVKSGKYKCTVPGTGINREETLVKTYTDDGYFGELALINHAPRAATITAVTDGELWVLIALRHSWLRKHRAVANAERFEAVIKAIPLFRDNLNPNLTSRLIDALEVVNMNPGDVICKQGDHGDAMYFILSGEVVATINNNFVRQMAKSEFFGERALVLDEGRAATCYAKGKVKLAKLSKESFNLIIPDSVIVTMQKHIAVNYGLPVIKASCGGN